MMSRKVAFVAHQSAAFLILVGVERSWSQSRQAISVYLPQLQGATSNAFLTGDCRLSRSSTSCSLDGDCDEGLACIKNTPVGLNLCCPRSK